jgi:hypothetical protein
MPNYTESKIYKIECNITNRCYIGSTTYSKIIHRLKEHERCYKKWKLGKYGKTSSFDVIGNGNYSIHLIESFPCNSKRELEAREGNIIKEYKRILDNICVNRNIPFRTIEETKELASERIKCSCGSCFRREQKSKHLKSKKHQDYLKSIKQ